jgi:hypothetical protein
LTSVVSASAQLARPLSQLALLPLCYLDSIISNLVIIVIWIVSFGLHMIICYACITLEIILATKILNIQGISYQFFKMLFFEIARYFFPCLQHLFALVILTSLGTTRADMAAMKEARTHKIEADTPLRL